MVAYLVIREGSQWNDVFRLVEGEAITIGRAPTNLIVIKDERCSRTHAEIFHSNNTWTLRDLQSRNGTRVGGVRVTDDYELETGDVVRIGNSHLAFVEDLNSDFPDASEILRRAQSLGASETITSANLSDSNVLGVQEPTEITHRKGHTRYFEPHAADDQSMQIIGRAATQLCRLAYELAKERHDVKTLCRVALDGLFDSTHADAGAVLLLPRHTGQITADDIEVAASRSSSDFPYHRVSSFLATTVLREGEGVLARNVMDDSTLARRDSKGEIHTTSVICVPIRSEGAALGLIHLYSTDAGNVTDPEDLEFTLAVADTLALALSNVSHRQELTDDLNQARDENLQLRERLGVQSEIVGCSKPMMEITQEIAQAASSRATVLIRGESGVGKELVARAVHFSGPRRKGPFVCLNCAALSESLLESELFGHEKGAFTGATDRKIGKFEAADEGTLMLDEIGEMSPSIQAKFLRVLEGHAFERVGGNEPIDVDVRVIAATNRDLEREVANNRFRRDLYFRLRVLEIFVPPLRKRSEDIAELAHYFLRRYTAETGRRIQGFTDRAMVAMTEYRWPGNVRELKNVIERAVVLTRSELIDSEDLALSRLPTATDLSDSSTEHTPPQIYEPLSLAEMERRHILSTLNESNWNKSHTANILGIERSTLDRKIRRYELAKMDPRRLMS